MKVFAIIYDVFCIVTVIILFWHLFFKKDKGVPKCKNPPPPPLVSRENLKLSLENSLKANKALAKMNDRLEPKCSCCGRILKKPEFPKDRPYKQ